MKHFKRLLALVLAFVLVFSCMGSAFAAGSPASSAGTGKGGTEKTGFRSETFKRENAYQYADNEIVRAIVVLENAPLADVAGGQNLLGGTTDRLTAQYSAMLAEEHADIYAALHSKNVNFDVVYDFDTLLNGFSCDVAYGDLDTIADLPGVETVYIANVYHVPTTQKPTMSEANGMTGNDTAHEDGYTGQGMVVAVLDTGVNLTHEAFGVYDGVLGNVALTEADAAKAVAAGQYVSAKIPFAYDYADKDNDVSDTDGHGTHVAGIAAGYAQTGDEVTFEGAAPGAQILAMKIFSDNSGSTTSDIYFSALEDALRLGADVVNMSIGSPGGFTYDSSLESEVFGNIYQRLAAAGVVVCAAAGNEYSMAEYATLGFIGPEYTDYGTVGNPSTFTGNVSVASAENVAFPRYAITVDGQSFAYNDNCEDGEHAWLDVFGGQTHDYVVVKTADGSFSMGEGADYELTESSSGAKVNDVTGKIAVVSRGSITFEEKVEYAAAAGAIGCIVVNNDNTNAGMVIETYEIPAVMAPLSAREILLAGSSLTTSAEPVKVVNANGGLMSDFSNWGTSPDLTISPAITSVGGNISSADSQSNDGYVLMSGTSMACPNMAGTFACVLSYLRNEAGITNKQQASQLARDLLESTALYVTDADDYLYSVRKQGAGLGSAAAAIAAYQTGAYVSDPLVELKDNLSDTFSFSVTLRNATSEAVTYTPSTVVMTDYLDDTYASQGIIMNTLTSIDGLGTAAYSCGGSVTVPANGTATVTVTVTVSEEGKAYLANFENGAFLEGYVEFAAEDKQPVHATYLGYCGDWTAAPVLEEYDFRDFAWANNWLNTDETGKQYAAAGYTPYDFMLGLVTDFNLAALGKNGSLKFYAGDNPVDYVEYLEEHISLTTSESDADYVYADLLYMMPYQLRNAKNLIMTVSNKETGDVYFVDDTPYLPKAVFDMDSTGNGSWASYGIFQYDGTDASGNPLPAGTVVHVQFDAVLPYEDARQEDCWSFDVTIDPKTPVIESAVFDEEAGTVTVTASDNQYLAGIYLADGYGQIVAQEVYSDEEAGQSHTAVFDVSEYLDEGVLQVCALDYATNETESTVSLFSVGETATITLVSPAGETRVVCRTGDTYTFQACTDEVEEDAEFLFWNSLPIEDKLDASGWEIYSYLWSPYTFYAGDSVLVTGDMTLYAVYQVGEFVEPEKPIYTYYQLPDYSGDWAIGGQPYEDGYRYDNPYVLDQNATTHPIKELDPNVDLSNADYNEFASAVEGFRFTFEKQSDGSYTVKNALTGQYLAYVDGALTMVDGSASLAAHWFVETDPNGHGSLMSNAANTDKLLLFNDDVTLQHEMMDDKTPLINYNGKDYYPSDVYILWLYKYSNLVLEPEYYTSNVTAAGAVNPPTPPTPGQWPQNPTEPEKPCKVDQFVDCTASWYHEAVDYVVSQGLMEGVGDSRFAPLNTLTRDMVATILYRIAGKPAVSAPADFTDVEPGRWYSDAIAWAQDTGIMKGVTAAGDLFAPSMEASREQIVTILWRYAGQPKAAGSLSAYADANQVSGFATEAMAWAIGAGIIQGSDNMLRPGASATRGEFACIVMRYLNGSYNCSKLP